MSDLPFLTSPNAVSFSLSVEEYNKFRDFFYRKTGIYFDESKRYFVDKRVLGRVSASGCASFREYFVMLRFQTSGEELQKLINSLTVNETYFYREDYQFECLVKSILPEAIRHKRRGDLIRIWSVPCSSGEEPYSLAMYLLECWPQVDDYSIELVASDIDTQILEMAKRGIYESRSLIHLTKPLIAKYFQTLPEGRFEISQDLRDSVDFTQVNVSDLGQMRRYRDFDVIFCRNLLIYFDDESRRIAAEALFNALHNGGFICLGHSESMSRITSLFRIRRFPEAIVYQKHL
jgi:chemotaxis protein methyltransferase CheR